MIKPFTLEDFVRESNRIEGITRTIAKQIDAHRDFLATPLRITSIALLVSWLQPETPFRFQEGMNVRVGRHRPPDGGEELRVSLIDLLSQINRERISPYDAHCAYETLHPLMDCNGRSGRAIWLKMMGGIEKAPLGFLWTWYYQSLNASRN